jgi:type VI secretion system secreted protein Hcp
MKAHRSLVLCALMLMAVVESACAIDFYLKVDGIDGDVSVPGITSGSAALSFSLGHSVTAATAGGAGRVVFESVSVQKYLDKSSPLLALRCAGGTSIRTVTLLGLSPDGRSVIYRVNLTEATITSVQVGGATGGVPSESVSFSFERIEWIYTPQKPDGSLGPPVRAGWDRVNNVAF